MALTRADANGVLTARVLDKGNPNSVLFERSVVNTPNADPALTAAELLSLSGMNLGLSPDLPGAPFTGGWVPVGVWQYNYEFQVPFHRRFHCAERLSVRTREVASGTGRC